MLVVIKDDYDQLCKAAAEEIADLVREKPDCVIGFATGGTPLGMYKELIRMHKQEGLDFSKITTFNLDEYVGLPPSHKQSYAYFMRKNLFDHINVDKRHIYIPMGMAKDIEKHCLWYEEQIIKAGGIDLQILGIGANGHIAFNEPGSSLGSRTRIKTLKKETIDDNARFFNSSEKVPVYALTMGVGTIMDAKNLVLLASGKAKAEAISKTIEGPITAVCPATIVQIHPKTTIYIDNEAASLLKGMFNG